jgi:transposase
MSNESSRNYDIYVKRTRFGMTLRAIGEEYNMSRQCVHTIVKRLKNKGYENILSNKRPEVMSDLMLSKRLITFLKRKDYYDLPIDEFLSTVTKAELSTCRNLSIKSLLELIEALSFKGQKIKFLKDIVERWKRNYTHV